jgi:prepilin peptidase CpaA
MEILIVIPLLVLLGVATILDWRTTTIPNTLTFGGALFGLVLQATLDGVPGLGVAAAGWALCLVCFLPLYMAGGMAAGDVKLMATVGAFVGPAVGIAACMFSLIAGGIIGIACIIYRRYTMPELDVDATGSMRALLKTRIPYAGAIAAGTSFIVLVPSVVPPALQFGAFS